MWLAVYTYCHLIWLNEVAWLHVPLSFLIVMQAGPSRANVNCDLNRNAENLALGLSVEQFIFFAR